MQIKAYATLRDLLGWSRLDLPLTDPTTVGDVLEGLIAQHPDLAAKLWDENSRLTGYITVLKNGRSIEYLHGLATLLAEGDTLSLFPPVGGG